MGESFFLGVVGSGTKADADPRREIRAAVPRTTYLSQPEEEISDGRLIDF
ncbi:MAG: hypothetical protein LW698_00120 [Planctomycetaceae bacterium]|jgi:hypothetical protein|nr:hypothetical protein [Planctomycetaceae bacterium]